jgi:hypothetical protein
MSGQWFSEKSFGFLIRLNAENSKQWFLDNKEQYSDLLLNPLVGFVNSLAETMLEIDRDFDVRPRIGKTISRIYRDTRFSKDKSIFKDRLWVTFKRYGKSNSDFPAFFFEITPYSYRYGMGFFSATPKSISDLRKNIDENEKKFIKIIRKIEKDNIFVVEGKMYKKNYYNGKYDEVASWYNRKNVYLVHNSEDLSELYDKSRITMIKDEFETLGDIYNFLVSSVTNN